MAARKGEHIIFFGPAKPIVECGNPQPGQPRDQRDDVPSTGNVTYGTSGAGRSMTFFSNEQQQGYIEAAYDDLAED